MEVFEDLQNYETVMISGSFLGDTLKRLSVMSVCACVCVWGGGGGGAGGGGLTFKKKEQ